jgi:hypothetical protein
VPVRSAQQQQAEREKEPPSTQFLGAALAPRRQEKMRSLAELARVVPSCPHPSAAADKAKPLPPPRRDRNRRKGPRPPIRKTDGCA